MAKTIKKVLVPLDGSKNSLRGLDEAIALAKQNNAVITGLFVVPSAPSELQVIRKLLSSFHKKQSKDFIAKARNKCKKNSVRFIGVLEYGDEGSKIVSYARANRFDMIVMGARGMGPVRQIILGSTSNYVLHNSKIPVLIVK